MAIQILYNENFDRLMVGDRELHCGDVLQVMMPQDDGFAWQTVSVEYNHSGWYFPEFPNLYPVGMWTKTK